MSGRPAAGPLKGRQNRPTEISRPNPKVVFGVGGNAVALTNVNIRAGVPTAVVPRSRYKTGPPGGTSLPLVFRREGWTVGKRRRSPQPLREKGVDDVPATVANVDKPAPLQSFERRPDSRVARE